MTLSSQKIWLMRKFHCRDAVVFHRKSPDEPAATSRGFSRNLIFLLFVWLFWKTKINHRVFWVLTVDVSVGFFKRTTLMVK